MTRGVGSTGRGHRDAADGRRPDSRLSTPSNRHLCLTPPPSPFLRELARKREAGGSTIKRESTDAASIGRGEGRRRGARRRRTRRSSISTRSDITPSQRSTRARSAFGSFDGGPSLERAENVPSPRPRKSQPCTRRAAGGRLAAGGRQRVKISPLDRTLLRARACSVRSRRHG